MSTMTAIRPRRRTGPQNRTHVPAMPSAPPLCECGTAIVTTTVTFDQISSGGVPFRNYLRLCDDCARLFAEDEPAIVIVR